MVAVPYVLPKVNIEKNSYKARTNARSFTTERSQMGIVSGVVNALTTPILDILRPSRKQNVIGNMRPMGNVQGANSVNAPNVFNPNDTPHHTIREQTENTPYWLMGGNDKADGYTIANIRAVQQQRESTNRYRPNAPGALSGTTKPMPYDAQYNMRTNPNKEVVSQVNRYNIGNQSLGSRAQNVTNLRNRAVNPSELRMNMPKVSGNMSTHGELSGKNTRETAINLYFSLDGPDLVMTSYNLAEYGYILVTKTVVGTYFSAILPLKHY